MSNHRRLGQLGRALAARRESITNWLALLFLICLGLGA